MAEKKTGRYCVIDHANKRGERDRVNSNRASLQTARDRGVLPADLPKWRRQPEDAQDDDKK